MKSQNNEHIFLKLIKDGVYSIDANGYIWRLRGGKNIRWSHVSEATAPKRAEKKIPSGYLQVRTLIDGKRYHCYAHRVVWAHHNGSIPSGYQVNHKDGNKWNNHPDNLELLTASENRKHAAEQLGVFRGERNGGAKLTTGDVLKIRKLADNGVKAKIIAEVFNISHGNINDIIARRLWKHIA